MISKWAVVMIAFVLLSFAVRASEFAKLKKCADTKDSLIRLQCYDNVVNLLTKRSSQSIETNAQKLAVRPTEPSSSAADVLPYRPVNPTQKVTLQPKVDDQQHLFSPETLTDIANSVIFEVAAVSMDQQNHQVITFSNGQVWRQSAVEPIELLPGDKVVLSIETQSVIYLSKLAQDHKIRVKRRK